MTTITRPNKNAPAELQLDEGNGHLAGKSNPSVPRPTVNAPAVYGVLRLDLTRLTGHGLARAVQRLVEAPPRAVSEVVVRRGQFPPLAACDYVRDQGGHLGRILVVSDDIETISAWYAAFGGRAA